MNYNKFEEWENSIEGIFDSINVHHSDTTDDEHGKVLIAKTIIKLPKKIREKIFEEPGVIFLFTYCAGVVRSLNFIKPVLVKGNMKHIHFEQPIILLNFQEMKKGREMDCIAHEIAHFILGHYKMGKISDGRCERKADNLTEKWGFKRAYNKKEYREFEKKIRLKKK